MKTNYSPFKKEGTIRTPHGTINYTHNMGTVYITHRRPEHFFKKFQGFGISITEIDVCKQENVYWLLFIYHNAKGEEKPYRIKLSETQYLETYTYEGDEQIIIPVKAMHERGEKGWE